MLLLPVVAQETVPAKIGSAKIYVVGDVKKPGIYEFDAKDGITVLEAIAHAEGLLPYAKKQAYIYRRNSDPRRKGIPVELAKIINRKSKDVTLEAGDILYIPTNNSPILMNGQTRTKQPPFEIPIDWLVGD